jgi:site-specific DNA-methyltransferase (adenine-specific)
MDISKYEYYRNDLGVLYNCDCLSILPHLEPVDLVLTDPPYGVNLGEHGGSKETRKGLLIREYGYEDTGEHFKRIVKPAIEQCLDKSIRAMVFCVPPSMWILPPPNAIGGVFIPGAVGRNKWGWSNLIHLLLYGVAPNLNLGAKPTAISGNSRTQKNGHPTPKPMLWMNYFLGLGSKQGDSVLDPFLGSGTTAVACERLKRKWIGIEIEEKYCAIAVKRIEAERKQLKLF